MGVVIAACIRAFTRLCLTGTRQYIVHTTLIPDSCWHIAKAHTTISGVLRPLARRSSANDHLGSCACCCCSIFISWMSRCISVVPRNFCKAENIPKLCIMLRNARGGRGWGGQFFYWVKGSKNFWGF